jgi:uncharacterized Zn finger protein
MSNYEVEKKSNVLLRCPACNSIASMEILKPIERPNGEIITHKCSDCGRQY